LNLSFQLNPNCKIIVAINVGPQQQRAETALKLDKIVEETFQHILTLFFLLPNTDKDNLEKLLIPSYEPSTSAANSPSMTAAKVAQKQQQAAAKSYDCVDAQCYANPVLAASLSCRIPSPLPPIEMPSESNSEDSSLSDSDRTLVEAQAAQDDISSNSNSPAWSEPRLSSPEEWMHGTATSSIAVDHSPQHQTYDDDDAAMIMSASNNNNNESGQPLYFKAMPYEEPAIWEGDETQKMIKVYTHKQMLIKDLKRELEPYVKVPQEYFKIFKMSTDNQAETECVRLTENLSNFKDGERLQIELGRALRDGEYKCKLYFLKLSEINDDMEQLPYLCETILRNGADVGVAKREILAHVATLNPKYKIPYEKCRLRRKTYKNASKVVQDDQKFGDDVFLTSNFEMVLQEMEPTSQPSTDSEDVVLFCRRWHSSTLTLGEFQEITIEGKTVN
jgi:ubiquitin carboxyl-terminal hydrolase 47